MGHHLLANRKLSSQESLGKVLDLADERSFACEAESISDFAAKLDVARRP
jgi:hypothetical protein